VKDCCCFQYCMTYDLCDSFKISCFFFFQLLTDSDSEGSSSDDSDIEGERVRG